MRQSATQTELEGIRSHARLLRELVRRHPDKGTLSTAHKSVVQLCDLVELFASPEFILAAAEDLLRAKRFVAVEFVTPSGPPVGDSYDFTYSADGPLVQMMQEVSVSEDFYESKLVDLAPAVSLLQGYSDAQDDVDFRH